MTKQEALNWLVKFHTSCHHANKLDIVYQGRIYAICKTCLATTVTAALKVGALKPESAAVAYTIHAGSVGYQPEIFHVTNLTSYWTGSWCATKQRAYEAAQAERIAMSQRSSETPSVSFRRETA